jgi:transposase
LLTTAPQFYLSQAHTQLLDFMNEIVAANADQEIHVILDNLNTHKPKDDRWLKRHTNVHFHFIPTYSSWLNQVECWFSILSRQALRGASFESPRQLREAIDRFVEVYNQKAAPFEWKKAVVFPSAPKTKYAYVCK